MQRGFGFLIGQGLEGGEEEGVGAEEGGAVGERFGPLEVGGDEEDGPGEAAGEEGDEGGVGPAFTIIDN